ncbi:NAD-dependent epimerase/dehydratase family protein [Shewanella marinintestina]|uniref:NAD-dependent epimerase/dehydratase family protein n=1 Tax=Shewanella marinintestina TaxID=190305 RepID=UPI00200E8850|nr:NAD-dependent epimerase/dehydratase family protein [Shewanella marinintestina]
MSILITGSSGFIGRNFPSSTDKKLKYVVRSNKNNDSDNFFIANLDRFTCWDGAFDGVDSIIHLAGLAHSKGFSEQDYLDVNVEGSLHLAREAARSGVKRFVFVSSILVNNIDNTMLQDGLDAHGNSPYITSKLLAERGLKEVSLKTGMELVIVRSALVYGADAPANFGSLTRLVKLLPLLPFGAISNKRSFIAVQNLSDLLLKCATHSSASGRTFLASDCRTVSMKEFTTAIAHGLNKSAFQVPIPVPILRKLAQFFGKSNMLEQVLMDFEIDSSDLYNVLGWKPPYTMEQAMASLSESKK